jgi:hypothetical protein
MALLQVPHCMHKGAFIAYFFNTMLNYMKVILNLIHCLRQGCPTGSKPVVFAEYVLTLSYPLKKTENSVKKLYKKCSLNIPCNFPTDFI